MSSPNRTTVYFLHIGSKVELQSHCVVVASNYETEIKNKATFFKLKHYDFKHLALQLLDRFFGKKEKVWNSHPY